MASIKGVLDEHRQTLHEARGIPPADAVRALFLHNARCRSSLTGDQQLARDFGVDLTQFGRQRQPVLATRPCRPLSSGLKATGAMPTEQIAAEQAGQAEIPISSASDLCSLSGGPEDDGRVLMTAAGRRFGHRLMTPACHYPQGV